MEVVILIPKKTITLVIFQGGGVRISPPPTSLGIQKSRESVETIDTPKYTVVQQLQVDITNSVMFCSGQNSSITKDDNFQFMQKRVMDLCRLYLSLLRSIYH